MQGDDAINTLVQEKNPALEQGMSQVEYPSGTLLFDKSLPPEFNSLLNLNKCNAPL